MKQKSENRIRNDLVQMRLTSEEKQLLKGLSERAGLTVGSYLRQLFLNGPTPRQVRRPPIERKMLARFLGELGHVGSNLNQLARTVNRGSGVDFVVLNNAGEVIVELRDAALRALGREP